MLAAGLDPTERVRTRKCQVAMQRRPPSGQPQQGPQNRLRRLRCPPRHPRRAEQLPAKPPDPRQRRSSAHEPFPRDGTAYESRRGRVAGTTVLSSALSASVRHRPQRRQLSPTVREQAADCQGRCSSSNRSSTSSLDLPRSSHSDPRSGGLASGSRPSHFSPTCRDCPNRSSSDWRP